MTDDVLQASIRAIRSTGDDDRLLANATRHRIQRSLVRRARGRRRLMQSSLVVAVLLVSGLAWAVSTGRLSFDRRATPAVEAPRDEQPTTTMHLPTPRPTVTPAIVEEQREEHRIEEPREPRMTIERRAVEARAVPAEVLYRAAHERHFRGGDHAAALAAWDAYLVAEPTGRFAIEARYNRALILVRLGRYVEARTALEPYARGEIEGGYRQAEAKQIVDRLAALNDSKSSGD
jgi:hypothetical protein